MTRAIGRALFVTSALACFVPAASANPAPAEEVVHRICGGCHDAGLYLSRKHDAREWRRIVNDMLERGAPGTEEEIAIVLDYLIGYYGKQEGGRE